MKLRNLKRRGGKLANELRKLRKYHEMTYKDMGDLIKVDPRTYRNKEKGESQFKANEMFIISKRFGKSIDEIFFN